MKPNYSTPKIHTGGVNVSQWSKLSNKDKKIALKKDWYVYYSFRHPKTNKLVRQNVIKAGANRFKNRRDRLKILKGIRDALEILLIQGFNPYQDNSDKTPFIKEKYLNKTSKSKITQEPSEISKSLATTDNHHDKVEQSNSEDITIKDAFKIVLDIKNNSLSPNTFSRYKSRINKFSLWLTHNKFDVDSSINIITKKVVINYLNHESKRTSSVSRNNVRADLSSFFKTLQDNDYIPYNFVKDINKEKASPTRHKSYTTEEETILFNFLEKEDPIMLLYVKFICYALLRPIEVSRLKISSINLIDKEITFKSKTKTLKTGRIPDKLIKEIPNLGNYSKDNFLFSKDSLGQKWESNEASRKDFYTKKFKTYKDRLGFGNDYGLYSFRHTYIAKLYRNLERQGKNKIEIEGELMNLTGHTSLDGLRRYLRNIDAKLPDDYSDLLE